ncbi:hypothetical protein [Streptomyces sp. NPDC050982]|uniref:hypothetical protein n=1 Tax=Streptomyces sp. NPDC050982 TaxID=3154746 RepID=UPI0033DA06A8
MRKPSSKRPAERFADDVRVDMIAEGEAPSRLRAGVVRFAPPCARTAWHRHAGGQTLHVTEGFGLVRARDGEVLTMRPGTPSIPLPACGTGTAPHPITS